LLPFPKLVINFTDTDVLLVHMRVIQPSNAARTVVFNVFWTGTHF